MAAAYPNQVKSFTSKQDFVDTVDAADPNSLQVEVVAVQATLGTNPNLSTAPSPTDTFNASATTFASVAARLANIEKGIVGDSHTHYVRLAGGNTLTPSAVGVVAITYKALAGQTANFVNVRASDNTLLAFIAVTGDASFKALTATSVAATSIIGNRVPIAFHVSGILTNGVKIAKFIAPVAMTLKGAYALTDIGSGTFTARVNNVALGMAGGITNPTITTTAQYVDWTDTNINAGDRVQIEVLTSNGSDLSVTVDAVTR